MAAKCIRNDAIQSTSSNEVSYQPAALAARGVFLRENGLLWCIVCNKRITLPSIASHTVGTRHCLRLERANSNFAKVDGKFVCKLCTDCTAADWESLLCHFIERDHFTVFLNTKKDSAAKDSQSPDSCFSYTTLLTNQIIEHELGIFYCCCCKKTVVGEKLIIPHINEEKHQRLQKTCHKNKFVGKTKEADARKLVKNFIYHVAFSKLHCNLCNLSINGMKHFWDHTRTDPHIKNLTTMQNHHQSPHENIKTDQKPRILHPNLSLEEMSKSFAKLMHDNSVIGPSENKRYDCQLCGRILSGQKTVTEHILGSKHRSAMEAAGAKLKLDTKSEEISDGSSSSWESTDNSSESWETYDDESLSCKSYENSSSSWESTDKNTESWETISMQGSSSGSQGSTLFKISPDLMALISRHFLQHLDKEILCVLCDAHLRSDQSLKDHIRSKYHVAEVNRHKDRIAKENKKLSVTSKKNHPSNSPANVIKKEPSQPATKFRDGTIRQTDIVGKVEDLQPTLLGIPQDLVPLISEHQLEIRKEELFCVACRARLQTPESLVVHTNTTKHVMKLNLYTAKMAMEREKLANISGRNSTLSLLCNTMSNKKSSESINSKNGVSTSMQKASTMKPQLSQNHLFDVPDYLIPMLAQHSLQRFERHVFCHACKFRLQHVNTLLEHISGKKHNAKLGVCRAEISSRGNSSQSTGSSITNTAANSPVNFISNKPLNMKCESNATTVKTITTNPQISQSNLMDIPPKLLPLITIHSLKHLEEEIYCVACQVHMTNESSLVSHTSSHRHAARLESFRASTSAKNMNVQGTSSSKPNLVEACRELKLMKKAIETKSKPNLRRTTNVSENKTGLENSINKLQIAEAKGARSKKWQQDQSKYSMIRPPRNTRSRKQDSRPKKTRAFDPKYLKVNMQHIYEVNPEKLRIIKLSCQLCIPKVPNTVYCLICEKSISGKLQTFYEHICSKAHTVYLSEAEQNDKHFINYPDQFSDLALAKEFMHEGEEESIQCFTCDESMSNEDVVILEHIENYSHKERKQLWNEKMDDIMRDILIEMKSTWYNIQKYWCVPCDIEYNTEFQFAEHMDSREHNNIVNKIGTFQDKLVYDSCISCATLWLGFPGIYPQHCELSMHKFLVRTGDFAVCKLLNPAITLLKHAVKEVQSLIELSDRVATVEKSKADALLKCLEDTVKPMFPDAKAYPFGSRVSGLGFPDSDIDVFLDCGTYDGQENAKERQEHLIKIVEQCLSTNQRSWEIEETLVTTRTPIIKLRHRDTELRCDVSFKNGLSVENTKLLKCYIDRYPPCRRLMLFLKKWLSYCSLSGSQYITNYATCWYIIFYLQSRSILPSVASLIGKEDKSKLIDGWETGISDTFDANDQELTFTELLHGFFVFYSKFDFRDSVACPLLGRTVLKQDFTELDLLPAEMAPYRNHVVTKSANGLVELFRIDSEMCIQDPYDLSHNLTKAVRKFTLNRFRRLCEASADVLNQFIQH